jgi:hypothetical protein
LEREIAQTKLLNHELVDQIETQKEVISRKNADFEELKSEVESMAYLIERYEKEFNQRLKEERSTHNIKIQEMETEKTKLTFEVENHH